MPNTPQAPSSTLSEERLYGASPSGAERLDFHPALGSASGAINAVPPGVYEGLRTFDRRKFFGLKTHLERLEDSVRGFRLPLEYDEETFVAALDSAAKDATAAFDSEARVRIDVTAAPAEVLGTSSNVLIAMTPYRGLPETIVGDGAYVRTAPGLARPTPGVKTSDFIPLREAWINAHGDPDAYEHIMLNKDGALLEGTQSNFVLVKDGALYGAPSGILPGVTMRSVYALARELGLEVKLEFVAASDLGSFDEAFMTTSVRSVVPISRVDEFTYPNGGPVTRRLSEAYEALTADDAAEVGDRRSARY